MGATRAIPPLRDGATSASIWEWEGPAAPGPRRAEVKTLPLEMFTASMGGNYQISSITALILLVPSIAFMLVVERFLRGDVLAKVGA